MKHLHLFPFEKIDWPEAKRRWNSAIERRGGEPLPPDDLAGIDAALKTLRGVFTDPPDPTRLHLRSEAKAAGATTRPITDGEPTDRAETAETLAAGIFDLLAEMGAGGASPEAVYYAFRAAVELDNMRDLAAEGDAAGAGLAGFAAGLALGLSYLHEHAAAAAGPYKSQKNRTVYSLAPEDAKHVGTLAAKTRRALTAKGLPYKTVCAMVYDKVLPELAALTGKDETRETDRNALKSTMRRAEKKHG